MESFREGTLIGGKYEVLELLGKGGMGEVYHARHRAIPEFHVAVKVLDAALTEQVENRERFRNEVIAGYRANHPNIVQMYEYFDLGKLQAFAMEFVSGGTLLEVMSDGALPVDVALSFMKQMARGLCALHRAGTHHRDLKPENVLVTPEGLAKLTDFGIARIRGSGAHTDCEGMLAGTPKYVPPEYVENGDSDHRGDIYALGVIAYEMIAGELPFRSVTNTSLLKERLQPHGLDLLSRISELPVEICAIIERCLSIQPIQRYPQAVDLVEAIVGVQHTYGLSDVAEYEETPRSTTIVWSDILREFEGQEQESPSSKDIGVEL